MATDSVSLAEITILFLPRDLTTRASLSISLSSNGAL